MYKEMCRELNAGNEIVIFHISSLFTNKTSRHINHSNVLVCRQLENRKESFTLFEPAEVDKIGDIKLLSFVKDKICRKFPPLKELKLVFGKQQYGQWDCLHRCCDSVAKVVMVDKFEEQSSVYLFESIFWPMMSRCRVN